MKPLLSLLHTLLLAFASPGLSAADLPIVENGQPRAEIVVAEKRPHMTTLAALDLTGVTTITLNANASKGAVRLEVLNEDGYRLRGFTQDDAVALTADDIAFEAAWKVRKLSDLPPGKYMLHVHLEKADLFAVTLK